MSKACFRFADSKPAAQPAGAQWYLSRLKKCDAVVPGTPGILLFWLSKCCTTHEKCCGAPVHHLHYPERLNLVPLERRTDVLLLSLFCFVFCSKRSLLFYLWDVCRNTLAEDQSLILYKPLFQAKTVINWRQRTSWLFGKLTELHCVNVIWLIINALTQFHSALMIWIIYLSCLGQIIRFQT